MSDANSKFDKSFTIDVEKIEAIDKKLLRYLTVRVKKFDLDANYFTKKEGDDKKESYKNQICLKDKAEIKKGNKATLQN